MEKILVLGGSGTVGTHLLGEIVRQELDQRMKFVCASRSDATRQKIESKGFKTILLDLGEPLSVEAAVDGVTTVFLLKPYGLKMLNYAKTVIDAASLAGVRAIVNLSAFGPGDSSIDLLTWHRLVDSYVERSGLAFTHLRPGFFMESLAARIDVEGGAVYDLSGSLGVPWVAAADIARTAAAIISNPDAHAGHAYSLVSEISSAPDIAAMLDELTGKTFDVKDMDESKTIDTLIARGREPAFARAIVEYGKVAPNFDGSDATGSVEAITGEPATTLRHFLKNQMMAKTGNDA